jgi:hypothetical protein
LDGLENLFSGFGPYEQFWVVIPIDDPGADVFFGGLSRSGDRHVGSVGGPVRRTIAQLD